MQRREGRKGLVRPKEAKTLPCFCCVLRPAGHGQEGSLLLGEGHGNSMEQVAGSGEHPFPRRSQDTQSSCSSAPRGLHALFPASPAPS